MHRAAREQRVLERRAHHRARVVDAPQRREVVAACRARRRASSARAMRRISTSPTISSTLGRSRSMVAQMVSPSVRPRSSSTMVPPTANAVLAWCTAVACTSGVVRSETERRAARRPAAHVVDQLVECVGRRLALQRVGGDRARTRAACPGARARPWADRWCRPCTRGGGRRPSGRCGRRGRVGADELLVLASRRRRRRSRRCGARCGMRSRAASTPVAQRAVVDEHLGVGVVDELHELVAEVAEVDVGRAPPAASTARTAAPCTRGSCAGTARPWCRGPTPTAASARGQPRGAVLDLAVGDPPLALHDRRRVGDGVGHPLPHRREALVHAATLRRSPFWRGSCAVIAHQPRQMRGQAAPMPRRRSRETAFEARHNAKIAPHHARPPITNATPVPRNSVLLDTP